MDGVEDGFGDAGLGVGGVVGVVGVVGVAGVVIPAGVLAAAAGVEGVGVGVVSVVSHFFAICFGTTA